MFQRDEGSGDQGRLVGSDRDPVPQSDLDDDQCRDKRPRIFKLAVICNPTRTS